MGCSMYLHVERLVEGTWTYVPGEFYDGCREIVYATLAGVRNNEGLTPLAEPRGLPMGPTTQDPAHSGQYTEEVHWAKYDGPGPDDRITSWLTLSELEAHNWTTFSEEWEETHFSVDTMGKLRELADGNPESVRIIFWFDDTIAHLERDERIA